VVPIFAHHFLDSTRENMRIKLIGENNCARATRHLLRLAGFAVTEFLPADAVANGPLAGYAITIDLAPAHHTPDAFLRPDPPTHQEHASASEEAPRSHRDASSPAFVRQNQGRTSAGLPAVAPANFRSVGGIHFDSVESALEAAVLRHVTQLVAVPVIVDRPGGVVHSDRELRIVAPNTGDAKADEAAAVAIEFGVLRGLLDLTAPVVHRKTWGAYAGKRLLNGDAADQSSSAKASADESAGAPVNSRSVGGKKWWPFGILLLAGALGFLRASIAAAPGRGVEDVRKSHRLPFGTPQGKKRVPPEGAPLLRASLAAVLPEFDAAEAQGQFAMGQGLDPCKAQTKLYASISQTANTQLVAGTSSKKIFVCSIHMVVAAATNVAVVEGTGSVCGTSTTGVSGFGGATAATGWNFAANGGIALGNGDASVGAEGASGDNLCIYNSGSGQVSGGISYAVE
jgi:hypothetical protein